MFSSKAQNYKKKHAKKTTRYSSSRTQLREEPRTDLVDINMFCGSEEHLRLLFGVTLLLLLS